MGVNDDNIAEQVTSNNRDHLRRNSKLPERFRDYVLASAEEVEHAGDPRSVEEALSRSDAELWRQAMQEEYDSLMKKKTWDLVDLPKDRQAISCKWVLRKKKNAEGKTVRYKARLVVRGCMQVYGVDFEETFSPVVRGTTLRYLIAIATLLDWDIDQMDAVTAFLQPDLEEEIYMKQPKLFEKQNKNAKMKVCKLRKALYGLKQSGRLWNLKLDKELRQLGFNQAKSDTCVYWNSNNGKIIIVAIYVDDFLIFSNNEATKNQFKDELFKRFDMKDLGEAHHCLGVRITRDRSKGITILDQEAYVDQVLRRFNLSDAKPVATPLECG